VKRAETSSALCGLLGKPWDDDLAESVIERGAALYRERKSRKSSIPAPNTWLLVEDNPADADYICELFEENGVPPPVHVSRLDRAVDALRTSTFAGVLTDLTLPDGRGLDAITRALGSAPDAAVVVLSGVTDADVALQAVRLGAQEYLTKGTVSASGLARTLASALERKRAQTRLMQLAHRDALTGVANRVMLDEQLKLGLARAERTGRPCGLIYIDLDGFKPVNDVHGHEAGDQLLCAVAQRLAGVVRKYDLVARLGGDEFAVFFSEVEGMDWLCAMARRVHAAIVAPFEIGGAPIRVGASLGVAVSAEASSPGLLLAAADRAMYEAKHNGKNDVYVDAGEGFAPVPLRRRADDDG